MKRFTKSVLFLFASLFLCFFTTKQSQEVVLPTKTSKTTVVSSIAGKIDKSFIINGNQNADEIQRTLAEFAKKYDVLLEKVENYTNTDNDEQRLVGSYGIMYCGGQCAAILNVYQGFIFGVAVYTQYEVDQVTSNCPCGAF